MLPFCSILRFLQWSSTQLRITSLSLDEQHEHHQTDRSCARWVSWYAYMLRSLKDVPPLY
uniref:Uncharacterized protein n=2 Tax=Aegilops tauschii subsp. strangulata TaxID=200361 RepID=A0A453EHB6_AEGTS